MSGALLSTALVRWLDLIGQAGVIGSVSFGLFVLPPSLSDDSAVRQYLRRVSFAALTLLAAASVGELVLRAMTMAGGGTMAAVVALPLVVERTHFGAIWVVRAIAIAVLCFSHAGATRTTRMISLVAAVATAATTALTGHAADGGDLRMIALSDWVHVVASGAWTGGLFCMSFVVSRQAREIENAPLLGEIADRFSRLAAVCVLGVLLTGAGNVWAQFADVSALWKTAYGRIFTAKVAFVTGILLLGAVNRYLIVPQMTRELPVDAKTQHAGTALRARFSRNVAGEVILAAVVFACTAFLGQLPPPRHDITHGNGQHEMIDGAAEPRHE